MSADDRGGVKDLERSLAIAKELHQEEHVARAYTNLSSSLTTLHDLPGAMAAFRDGIAYCDDHDLDAWKSYMRRAVAEIIVETLGQLAISYPELPEREVAELAKVRAELEAE